MIPSVRDSRSIPSRSFSSDTRTMRERTWSRSILPSLSSAFWMNFLIAAPSVPEAVEQGLHDRGGLHVVGLDPRMRRPVPRRSTVPAMSGGTAPGRAGARRGASVSSSRNDDIVSRDERPRCGARSGSSSAISSTMSTAGPRAASELDEPPGELRQLLGVDLPPREEESAQAGKPFGSVASPEILSPGPPFSCFRGARPGKE